MKAVLPVVLAAQFVVPMSISGTALALPVIAGDLGTDPTPLQWVVNGFNIAFALFTVVWGAVSDRIGHRTSFRIGVVLTAVASAVSAVAPSLYLLDVARVFAGIGAAAVLVGSTSILSLHFHGTARATAFALFGTVNGLGLALGPTISGLLVAAFEWRACSPPRRSSWLRRPSELSLCRLCEPNRRRTACSISRYCATADSWPCASFRWPGPSDSSRCSRICPLR